MFATDRIFGFMTTLLLAAFAFICLIRSWQTGQTWLTYLSLFGLIGMAILSGLIGWKLFREQKSHGGGH
jgi:hypothetical protein